jgi:hypothetical protein
MERYFNRLGGPASYLGYPTSDEMVAGAGRFNSFEFQGSLIAWHPLYGVHEVHGAIGEYYSTKTGGAAGAWGFPVSDEYPDGAAGRSSDFEGGILSWTPTDGVLEVFRPAPEVIMPAAGDWPRVSADHRMRYVMSQLVERYGFPADGAAGVVGNLWVESGVLPNRLEGSRASTPMRAPNFAGVVTDFTALEVMNRANPNGPRLPGVGLAQWTSGGRRSGLFMHAYIGSTLRENVLFSMDAQIDYLVTELQRGFPGVHKVVMNSATTVETSSDEVVYNFEIPGAILEGGRKLPRTDPRVKAVFDARREPSRRARASY